MNKFYELQIEVETFFHAVAADKKFFAAIAIYVEKLHCIVAQRPNEAKKDEVKFLAQKIESFFDDYRPDGHTIYIPPPQTSRSDDNVRNIFRLATELASLSDDEFNGLKAKNKEIDDRETVAGLATSIFWDDIHPRIAAQSRPRYESKHYADAVESALKEVNAIVKDHVKRRKAVELDGAELMHTAFSPKSPIIVLDDLSTDSGRSIQQGYMEIFAGAMTGVRNPKAHANVTIDDKRARHFLYLASLLLHKLDERL